MATTEKRRRLRKFWFSVHKWIGLFLFLILIPLSASGSLLVWHDVTDRLFNPQRYQVSHAPASLPPSAYVAAARTMLQPDARIATIELPQGAGKPVVVIASTGEAGARPGPPPRHSVWVDPATAQVVDHADPGTGVLRVLHVFHGSLMIPQVGRKVVGWLGWAMFVSCLTGIYLWWPTIGRTLRGFRWKRGPLVSGNLHHQVGIWIAIPLAVLSFTGAYISFPDFFRGVASWIAGDPAPNGDEPRSPRSRPRPVEQPALSPEAAVAALRASVPAAQPVAIRYPTERAAEWTIVVADIEPAERKVDDATGKLLPADKEKSPAAERTARLMRIVHDGHDTNLLWQIIVFAGGLAPLVLGITGAMMWHRTRRWRRAGRPALRGL
jgi:uncharacterized iron-regulated membrane protein